MARQRRKKTDLQKLLDRICKSTLQASVAIAENDSLKGLSNDDTDSLAEAIELLNDIYEILYDKVFEDSESICKGAPDQL